MLSVTDLHVKYGHIHALHGVSLEVPEGQVVAVVGANGAGKTTLMTTLAGLQPPAGGRVLFQGQALPKEANRILARGICLVPERRRLYANLTVKENLMMGAYLRKDRDGIRQDLEAMYQLYPILRERIGQYAGTLSGGEQQMLAIARGLMSRPRLLLLDEPSLGLAPLMVQHMFETIRAINQTGVTVLLAEQNAFQALAMAHQAFVLETGRVVVSGSGRDLLENPLVRKAYLGIAH